MSIFILGKEIPLYGLLYFTGIVIAGLVAIPLARKKQIDITDLVASAAYSVILGGIGAKVLFIIVSYEQIVFYKLSLMQILRGGFVFYGGLIGGLLGLVIYVKQFKRNMPHYFDVFAAVLPLGHAFGRIGCFFAGCCYGMEYHGPFSHTYTQTEGLTPLGVPLFPIQLLEALLLATLSIVLIIVFFKFSNKNYLVTQVYIYSYAVIRFVLEFFRGDKERGAAFALSTSQWISIALIVICFIISIIFKKIHLNRQSKAPEVEA